VCERERESVRKRKERRSGGERTENLQRKVMSEGWIRRRSVAM